MMKFTFSYTLIGDGWCEATLTEDERAVTIIASYLSDALGDLVRAVNALVQGAPFVACAWQAEPGEYRWLFSRSDNDVLLTILRFDQTFSSQRDEQGELLFTTQCSLRRFALQVKNQLDHIFNDTGVETYEQHWRNHRFPMSEYEQLEHYFRSHNA